MIEDVVELGTELEVDPVAISFEVSGLHRGEIERIERRAEQRISARIAVDGGSICIWRGEGEAVEVDVADCASGIDACTATRRIFDAVGNVVRRGTLETELVAGDGGREWQPILYEEYPAGFPTVGYYIEWTVEAFDPRCLIEEVEGEPLGNVEVGNALSSLGSEEEQARN